MTNVAILCYTAIAATFIDEGKGGDDECGDL
jgi:hypothetical protein